MSVRSLWDHLRFRVSLHARLAIDTVMLAIGLVLILFGGRALTDIIGWATAALSVFLFAKDFLARQRQSRRTRVRENDDFAAQLAAATLPDGFRREWGVLPDPEGQQVMRVTETRPYITSDAVNAALDGASNPLLVAERPYEMPEKLEEHRGRCVNLQRPAFNQAKIGLRSDVTPALLAGSGTVRIQHTDYFKGAATNERACQQFESCRHDRHGLPDLLVAVSDYVVARGRLIDLEDSCLSNHIGVSTLVVTADGYLAIQEQGAQMISANEFGIGASGSVDRADLKAIGNAPTLQALIRHAMQREAEEELSARFEGADAGTWITGYARYLARGGKPEFFGISRSSSDFTSLHASKGDLDYVAGIDKRRVAEGPEGLRDTMAALLREGGAARVRYSPSTIACLRMAIAFLDRAPLPASRRAA